MSPSCALTSCRQTTSGSERRSHRNKPLLPAERMPFALSVTMRNIGQGKPKKSGDSATFRIPMRQNCAGTRNRATPPCPIVNALQQQFIEFALQTGVLKFGEFKTKAGRLSPYFFNAGLFNRGGTLGQLARFYARTLLAAREAGRVQFDMLFGPAYKGITLASATAVALADLGADVPFAFNRKEAKDHGEGGVIVGSPLAGRVVIVDDVITAGTSVRESVELIRAAGAAPAGVLIALARMERSGADDALSAESA